MKKILKKLFSMKTAIGILILLVIACVIGSIVTQGQSQSYYESNFSEKVAWLILLTGADDVFHSWWFMVLTGFLCLNLLGCNVLRLKGIVQHMKGFDPEKRIAAWNGEAAVESSNPSEVFKRMNFGKVVSGNLQETQFMYAVRHRAGLLGAWLTHLGMLIIILGFALGQITTVKYTVYGVPGQTKELTGTPYTLTIDDFQVSLRDDDTVDQYTAQLTLTNTETGASESGETSVNHPATLLGYQAYQNSTGWAADVRITKNDEPLQTDVLCAGEYTAVKDKEDLVIMFTAFYPDYVSNDGQPSTKSSSLNNPAYLYAVYYQGQVIGMNVLIDDYITIDEYTVYFENPRQYTLIQLKHDPFTWLALIGGIVMLIAIFLAFYYRTEEVWAVRSEDGKWKLAGESRKGGILFTETLIRCAEETEKGKTDE